MSWVEVGKIAFEIVIMAVSIIVALWRGLKSIDQRFEAIKEELQKKIDESETKCETHITNKIGEIKGTVDGVSVKLDTEIADRQGLSMEVVVLKTRFEDNAQKIADDVSHVKQDLKEVKAEVAKVPEVVERSVTRAFQAFMVGRQANQGNGNVSP